MLQLVVTGNNCRRFAGRRVSGSLFSWPPSQLIQSLTRHLRRSPAEFPSHDKTDAYRTSWNLPNTSVSNIVVSFPRCYGSHWKVVIGWLRSFLFTTLFAWLASFKKLKLTSTISVSFCWAEWPRQSCLQLASPSFAYAWGRRILGRQTLSALVRRVRRLKKWAGDQRSNCAVTQS